MSEEGFMTFTIDKSKINSLQVAGIMRVIERAKHAHMTDIDMRINGTNEYHEADWIKHLTFMGDVMQR